MVIYFGFTDLMIYFFVATWLFLLKFSSGGRVKRSIPLKNNFFAFSAYENDECVSIVENIGHKEKHKEIKIAGNLTTHH